MAVFVILNHISEFLYFIHNNTALLNSGPGRYPCHCLSGAFLSESNDPTNIPGNLIWWGGVDFSLKLGFICDAVPPYRPCFGVGPL